ncbi:MAG: hypothetical protein IPI00_00450 [Flavobacteriales bacterium]|nr:hypothetical protein [Flavobacteriales bacterium]
MFRNNDRQIKRFGNRQSMLGDLVPYMNMHEVERTFGMEFFGKFRISFPDQVFKRSEPSDGCSDGDGMYPDTISIAGSYFPRGPWSIPLHQVYMYHLHSATVGNGNNVFLDECTSDTIPFGPPSDNTENVLMSDALGLIHNNVHRWRLNALLSRSNHVGSGRGTSLYA